jgi:hypothetical protein
MEESLMDMLVRLIVPDEILKSFKVSSLKEWGDCYEITLTEKEFSSRGA